MVADTEQWLGNLMRELGHLDEALDYFKSALVGKKAKVGNNHEDVADAMHNMAIILDDMQKHELSIGCYQEVSWLSTHDSFVVIKIYHLGLNNPKFIIFPYRRCAYEK